MRIRLQSCQWRWLTRAEQQKWPWQRLWGRNPLQLGTSQPLFFAQLVTHVAIAYRTWNMGKHDTCGYLLGVFSKSNKIKEHQADQQIFSFKSRDEETQRKLQCLRWSIHSSTFGVEHWYSVSKNNSTMDTNSDRHLIYTTMNVHHSSNIWWLLSLSLTVSLGLSCCRWVNKPIQYLGSEMSRLLLNHSPALPSLELRWWDPRVMWALEWKWCRVWRRIISIPS